MLGVQKRRETKVTVQALHHYTQQNALLSSYSSDISNRIVGVEIIIRAIN